MENIFTVTFLSGLMLGFIIGCLHLKSFTKYIIKETIDEIDSQNLDDDEDEENDDLDPWEKNPDYWKKG